MSCELATEYWVVPLTKLHALRQSNTVPDEAIMDPSDFNLPPGFDVAKMGLVDQVVPRATLGVG
eukprot:4177867-Amphidinium_carterae.1